MTATTISQETQKQAIQHFENKLNFEIGPVGLHYALKKGETVQIIDLRTKELYEKGHIPGALNLLLEEIENNLAKLSKDKTIVVYCYDIVCNLSTKAALLLTQKGYKVKELVGGWQDWINHQLKVETQLHTSTCGTSSSSCG